MIPIAGIAAGAFAAAAMRGKQRPDPQLRGMLIAMLLVFAIIICVGALVDGLYFGFAVLALLLVALLPWGTCWFVLVPLGLPRLAYYVARLANWYWPGDTRGGGLVAASLATLRRPTPEKWAWIERKRNGGKELRGGGLLAAAIALEARGETERARRSLAMLPLLEREGCCRTVIALGFEWLAAEAAERGDWKAAAHWGLHPPLGSRAAVVIGRVAERSVGNPWRPGDTRRVSNARLWYAWLGSFRWLALLPLVRWSNARSQEAASDDEAAWIPDSDAAHDRAIMLQARAAASGKRIAAAEIVALGEAWSEALGNAELEQWRVRVKQLGAREHVLHDVRAAVVDEIAEILRRADAHVGAIADDATSPPVLREAAMQVRAEYLDAIESACESLLARVKSKESLPANDEWNEWQAAVHAYDRAYQRAGLHNRVVVFNVAHHPMCSLAVWLWNERKEYTIAHAIFRWLLMEAMAVGDEKAIELQKTNAACKR